MIASNISVMENLSNKLATIHFLEKNDLPDVIFVETKTLGSAELNFIEILKEKHPRTKLLLSVDSSDLDTVRFALDHKIDGFLTHNATLEELTFAVQQIYNNQSYLSSQVGIKYLGELMAVRGKTAVLARAILKISKRELEVLKFVVEGCTNADISEKLYSSKRTIEGNRKKLLEKTGTRNTAELVGFAVRNRIVS